MTAARRVGVTIVLVLSLAGLLGVWWQSIGTPVARARPIPTGVLRIVVFGDSLAFRWGTARPARDGLAPRLAARFAAVRPEVSWSMRPFQRRRSGRSPQASFLT